MTGKHQPTPPARREAALQFQAEQLLKDAAAWGYSLVITPQGNGESHTIRILSIYPRTS